MRNKKNVFSFIRDNKKKVSLLTALVLCAGVYAASGIVKHEDSAVNEDIPLHDGDVLVTSDEVAEPENTNSYFQELRATLDMDRSKIISMLSDSEGSASTSAEKKKASEEKISLLNYMEQEKTVETLIKNKGLPECFVVITDSGVNVTVNTDNLDQSTVTKICEIIMRQTQRAADEIVIQEVS